MKSSSGQAGSGGGENQGGLYARSYLARWRSLSNPARLYLLHAALLTSSLAIYGLLFNLLIEVLGYPRTFLGTLGVVSLGTAAVLSLPLWWLVTRIGLRQALVASAVFQATSALICAIWPQIPLLIVASAFTGAAAVLFQVSSPPFMMAHSDDLQRDHLFSANAAINISLAGVGSLVAGFIPGLLAPLLGVGEKSALAYRVTFGIAGCGLLLSLLPLVLIGQRERSPMTRTAGRVSGRLRWQLPPLSALHPITIYRQLPPNCQAIVRRPWPILMLLLPPFWISWGAALVIQYLNLFFNDRFAIPLESLGTIFAALGIATGLAALLGPTLSARIGKLNTIMLTQALSIPFLLVLGFVPVLSLAVGAALIRAMLFNLGSPLYDALAMERTDERARPAVIGLINGAYSVGYLVAPKISTVVQVQYGWSPLFIATSICYGLAVLSYLLLWQRQPRLDKQSIAIAD